jgi:hypothetical protein
MGVPQGLDTGHPLSPKTGRSVEQVRTSLANRPQSSSGPAAVLNVQRKDVSKAHEALKLTKNGNDGNEKLYK